MATAMPPTITHARRVLRRREERSHSRSFSSSGSNLLEDTANLSHWVGMCASGHCDRPERPALTVPEAAPGVAPGPDHGEADRVARALGPVDVLRGGRGLAPGRCARQHGPVPGRPPEVGRPGCRRDGEPADPEANRHLRTARVPVPRLEPGQPLLRRAQLDHRPRDVLATKDAQDLLRSRHLHQHSRIDTLEAKRYLVTWVLSIDRYDLDSFNVHFRVSSASEPLVNSAGL